MMKTAEKYEWRNSWQYLIDSNQQKIEMKISKQLTTIDDVKTADNNRWSQLTFGDRIKGDDCLLTAVSFSIADSFFSR